MRPSGISVETVPPPCRDEVVGLSCSRSSDAPPFLIAPKGEDFLKRVFSPLVMIQSGIFYVDPQANLLVGSEW